MTVRHLLRHGLVACAALVGAPAAAQDQGPLYRALGSPEDWTIRASERVRIEGIDGQFRPNAATHDQLLSFRTVLFAEYHPGPFRIGAEVWDVRGYMTRDRTSARTGEINALEPIQAYVGYDLGHALGSGDAAVTVGRFTQDIGARRFMARQRFRNTTNTFLGAKLDWNDAAGNKAILFWTMPQRILPDDAVRVHDNAVVLDHFGTDLQFFGGVLTKADVIAGGELQVEAFGTLEHDTRRFATQNRRLFTPALRLDRSPKKGKLDWDVEGAYQIGSARRTTAASDTRDLSVSAYFLHAALGYTFPAAWSPRVMLGYDLASGDDGKANGYTRFDTLFGARRELGPTDLYGLLQRANLSSPEVRLGAKPSKRLDGYLSYRPAWLERRTDAFAASGVRDRTGASGTFAGDQIEALAHYALIPDRIDLEGGAVYLAKGRFLTDAPNAPRTGDTTYGYANVTFLF